MEMVGKGMWNAMLAANCMRASKRASIESLRAGLTPRYVIRSAWD
jgi:hypothetical protein